MKSAVAVLLLLGLSSVAHAEVLRLTTDTWTQATAGKTVFVKFFAPWCEHCQEMAPAWEKLADKWKDHAVGLIAEVDCTDEASHGLCEEMAIENYPTLLYGDPFEVATYEGSHEFAALSAFADEHLASIVCSPVNLDPCETDAKEAIRDLQDKTVDELLKLEEEAAELLHHINLDYEDELEKIQLQRENLETTHQEKLEAIYHDFQYKYLRQVLAQKEAAKNDEL